MHAARKSLKTFETAFDNYIVDDSEPLGSGGSGTVLRVRSSDGKILALKLLNVGTPRQKLRRFKNEILFCEKPHSRNIIQVLDYGSVGGSLFYVMDLYPLTLRALINRGLPPAEVLPLFSQILDGVEAAHLLGVCHRDLKPENILYDSTANCAVVADFGIARFTEDELFTAVETAPNERLANFAYAAPEQRVRGRAVNEYADIFALGLILNEMFTGHVPQGTAFKQVAEVAPDFAYLDGLIELMVRQQPEQRPHSIAKLKGELIGRGNEFVERQRLDALKQQVVPDSEVSDSIVADPIRAVRTLDYRDSTLTIQLNQKINPLWERCFRLRATAYSGNVSAAMMMFRGDVVMIRVNDHFLPQAVTSLKQFLNDTNAEYDAEVRKQHRKRIQQERDELQAEVRNEEARLRALEKVKL